MGGARRHRHRSRSAQYGSAGESPVNAGGDWKSGNVLQMLKGGLHIVRRGSLTRPFLSSGGWLQGFSPRNEDQRQAPPVMPFYRKPIHYKDQQSDDAYLYGYGLLALCFFAFHFVLYTIIVAKWMPDTGIPLVDFWKYDYYYCLVLPLILPMCVLFVFWNWLGMKLFRHN